MLLMMVPLILLRVIVFYRTRHEKLNSVLAFHRRDHLLKHIQTHKRLFVDQLPDLSNTQAYPDIKQEIEEDSNILEGQSEVIMQVRNKFNNTYKTIVDKVLSRFTANVNV